MIRSVENIMLALPSRLGIQVLAVIGVTHDSLTTHPRKKSDLHDHNKLCTQHKYSDETIFFTSSSSSFRWPSRGWSFPCEVDEDWS